MLLSSYIKAKQLELILSESGIPKTIELMLNSVLVPFGIRTNNNLSLKFAHKSFQEFFLARAIFQHLLFCVEEGIVIPDLNITHTEGVIQFLSGFLKTEIPGYDHKRIKERIKTDYNEMPPNTVAELLLNF